MHWLSNTVVHLPSCIMRYQQSPKSSSKKDIGVRELATKKLSGLQVPILLCKSVGGHHSTTKGERCRRYNTCTLQGKVLKGMEVPKAQDLHVSREGVEEHGGADGARFTCHKTM